APRSWWDGWPGKLSARVALRSGKPKHKGDMSPLMRPPGLFGIGARRGPLGATQKVGDLSARPESPRQPYAEWAAALFDPSGRHAKPEALRGIRVLDLSVIIFGPATADFLGELGAEVIKVEMPGQGDVTRILGHAGCFWKDVSVAFFPQNHGKYHVGVDMHHPDGQALIRKLAARSDVLVENFKPGTTESKWGLGYR